MPTLGTQNIATSYPQLLKTDGLGGIDGTLQTITDGDNTSSALQLSTTGVRSTGTLNAAGATTLSSSLAVTGAVTLSSSLAVTAACTLSSSLGVTAAATFNSSVNATTGTVTIGTATISTATISTATIPLQLGAVTFGSSITASTGTSTIGTVTISSATISTATISTATIARINGITTFGTGFTSSTGTNTIGTIESTTINNTGLATTGTLQVGASGPKLTAVTFATAAYTGGTVLDIDHATTGSNVSTGTLAASGVALGDIVIGTVNSIGSTTGATPAGLLQDFRVEAANVLRFTIFNSTQTTGTIPAGTIFATALRFTA